MNTRESSLQELIFPQGLPDQIWLKILSTPTVILILASFTPDILGAVKSEIRSSIGTLLQIRLLDALVGGWKRYDKVNQALERSRQTPNDPILESLAKHTFKSVHHPYLELYMDEKSIGKIEFEFTVSLEVEGLQLKILNGEISEILAGSCQGSVQLALAGAVLSKAQTGHIALPGSIAVTPTARPSGDAVPLPERQAGREQTKTVRVAPQPELREQSVQKQAPPLPPHKQSRTSNKVVLLVGFIAVLCICTIVALFLLTILRSILVAQTIPTNPPALAPGAVLLPPTSAPFLATTAAPPPTSAPFLIPTAAPAPTIIAPPPPTVPFAPPPTAVPTLPSPGLYVTSMGMDQAQPVHGQLINFTVSFLNTTGGDLTVKWRVYIYRADAPSKSNTDSAPVLATFPPGPTLGQPVPMNFKYGASGNACDNFFARVDTVDSSNKPIGELTTTDGKVFQKDFAVCN